MPVSSIFQTHTHTDKPKGELARKLQHKADTTKDYKRVCELVKFVI